jgi:hypothetical protein
VAARLFGVVAVVVAMFSPAHAASSCAVPVGRLVILSSRAPGALDPDVFVWDTRQRVVEYAQGYWHRTRDVFSHTLLANSGTRAVVVECAPGVVPSSEVQLDAVGVRIVSGPNRGRYGWVTTDDIRIVAQRT